MANKNKEIQKLMQVSKRYPVIGAKRLLNVNLAPYQEDMLERMWKSKFIILNCSRRTGKSFVTAVYLALRMLLFEKLKAGIVAPVFRQSQTLYGLVEDIYKGSNFFQMMVVNDKGNAFKKGSSMWYADLHNGSSLKALPLSDKIRSLGFSDCVIEEFGFGDDMIAKKKSIIDPMLFTKRSLATGGKVDPYDKGNSCIIISTATYQWNDFYKMIQDYKKEIDKGNEKYDIISYDYRDAISSGLFEEELVLREFEEASSIYRKMEYLCLFPSEDDGFITYKLIHNKVLEKEEEEIDGELVPKTRIEFEQRYDEDGYPVDKYILAMDDADGGENNWGFALIRLSGETKRIVQLGALNKARIQEKIEKIRELYRNFNIVRIVMDQRNKNIVDNISEPYQNPITGEIEPAILLEDDEEQEEYVKNKFGENVKYEKLIRIVNFTAANNEMRARALLGTMEKGRIKMPPLSGAKSKKEEDALNEMKKAIDEIISIRGVPSGRYIKYDSPPRKNKDRFTCIELGSWSADEYIKEMTTNNNDNIYIGGWRR